MTLKELARLGQRMRAAQKRAKAGNHYQNVREAKDLEARFDYAVQLVLSPPQATLFPDQPDVRDGV